MAYLKFVESIESVYARQLSQSCPKLTWPEIWPLLTHLKEVLNQQITPEQQLEFIDLVLKYIELVLGFLSTFTIIQYTAQLKYSSRLLEFLPAALNAQKLSKCFVSTGTVRLLDMLIYMGFSTFANRQLLLVLNRTVGKCDRATKIATGNASMSYIFKLMDLLATYGDHTLQCDLLETVFRLYPHLIKTTKHSILPEMPELSAALSTDISAKSFDSDIRVWLSKFNRNSPHIFSIKSSKVTYGKIVCRPHQDDAIWLDFNLKDQLLSFSTLTGEDDTEWDLVYIPANYVKSVEVHKSGLFVDVEKSLVITMILIKSCISQNPSYWNALDKTVEIVISEEQNEQTSRIISHVLPKMFGKTFQHRSSRSSFTSRKLYRPLSNRRFTSARSQSVRSNRRSSTSKISSASELGVLLRSSEKPRSEDQHSVTSGVSAVTSSETRKENQTPNESADSEVKLSHRRTVTSISSNASLDLTNLTRTDSNAVSSRPVTPVLERIESLQDNIVTSSRMFEDEIIASSLDIASGRSKPRAILPINDTIDFQPSELFSSSPYRHSLDTHDFMEKVLEGPTNDFEIAALRFAKFDSDASSQNNVAGEKILAASAESLTVINEKLSLEVSSNFETSTENPQNSINKHSLIQLHFKSTNSDFETATEGLNMMEKPEVDNITEKRSLAQLILATTNKTADLVTVTEECEVNVKSLGYEDVAQRLTQFDLNSQSLKSDSEKLRLSSTDVNQDSESKSVTKADVESITAKTSQSQDAISQSSPLKSPVKVTEIAPETIEVCQETENIQNFTTKLLRVILVREPLVDNSKEPKITETFSSESPKLNSAPSNLIHSNSFFESAHQVEAKIDSEASSNYAYTQFENAAKKLTQFELDSSPQLEQSNVMIEDHLLRALTGNLVKPAENRVTTNQEATSKKEDFESEHQLKVKIDSEASSVIERREDHFTNLVKPTENPVTTNREDATPKEEDLDKTTQDLFIQLSPVKVVEEVASEDVFQKPTQEVLGQLSLKVNVGVYTNESPEEEKNVLQATEVESTVEEIFIDLTKEEEAAEVKEDRHMSSQELITILDKTGSQSSVQEQSKAIVDHFTNLVKPTNREDATSKEEDLDKTTQDLFTQLSPVKVVEEVASEDVFQKPTQEVLGQLSLKVNVGVFTNESPEEEKNVLQTTEVESTVEEIFIDLTKEEEAAEVKEDRHMSSQELITILDKTGSQSSVQGNLDPSDKKSTRVTGVTLESDIRPSTVSPSKVKVTANKRVAKEEIKSKAPAKVDLNEITVCNLVQPERVTVDADATLTNNTVATRKPEEKKTKPKQVEPRRLFDPNNLDYMDTLKWSSSESNSTNVVESGKRGKLTKSRNNKKKTTKRKTKKQSKSIRKQIPTSTRGLNIDPSCSFFDLAMRDLLTSTSTTNKCPTIHSSSDTVSQSSPFEKLPELEVEPIDPNSYYNPDFSAPTDFPPFRKINVLQNITVVKPKRPSPCALDVSEEPSRKWTKIDQEPPNVPENVRLEHPADDTHHQVVKELVTWAKQKDNLRALKEFIEIVNRLASTDQQE